MRAFNTGLAYGEAINVCPQLLGGEFDSVMNEGMTIVAGGLGVAGFAMHRRLASSGDHTGS